MADSATFQHTSKTETSMMFLSLNQLGGLYSVCVCVVGIEIITAMCEQCTYVLIQLALPRN